MNVKKQAVIGIALVAALGISGCGVTELNEEQNAQAAEYLAGVMLKHTKEYEKSLIYSVATTFLHTLIFYLTISNVQYII